MLYTKYLVSSKFGAAMVSDTSYLDLGQTSQLKAIVLYTIATTSVISLGSTGHSHSDQLTTDSGFHTNPSVLIIARTTDTELKEASYYDYTSL